MSPDQTSPRPQGQPQDEPQDGLDSQAQPPVSVYTPEEEKIIKKRLADLGYI
jgi:hypothetical protein